MLQSSENYLSESGAFTDFKNFVGKIKEYDSNWPSIVSINHSTTNIGELECKAGPRVNLVKITTWNIKDNISPYNSDIRRRNNNVFKKIKIKALGVSRAPGWANCIMAEFNKINSHSNLTRQIEENASKVS